MTNETRTDLTGTPATGEPDNTLLALLVCPVDHGSLERRPGQLVCTECGRVYQVVEGIPDMLPDDAR